MKQARLTQATLAGADFREAELRGADFTGARFDRQTQWPDGFDALQHGAVPRGPPGVAN